MPSRSNFTDIDIRDDYDVNSTSTASESLDIKYCDGVFIQVITSGNACVVTLETSGEDVKWIPHHMDGEITGSGASCITRVIARYVRMRVKTAAGSAKTARFI